MGAKRSVMRPISAAKEKIPYERRKDRECYMKIGQVVFLFSYAFISWPYLHIPLRIEAQMNRKGQG